MGHLAAKWAQPPRNPVSDLGFLFVSDQRETSFNIAESHLSTESAELKGNFDS